ncbi:UNVERIFIED_ORG: hypothetical protein CLV66_106221 [Actinomadura viridilutea]|nr:hypothetical protein [Actinomadura rubrobrunea]
MSTGSRDFARDFDRAAAERLLDGAADGRRAVDDPLARLLAGAAAPARESELAGEEAAVAAFRAASAARKAAPRGTGRRRLALSRVFTAKVAALALAGVVGGGVAVAAGTGSLPVVPVVGGDTSASSAPARLRSPSASTSLRRVPDGASRPSPRPTPSRPGLEGQCRTFQRLDKREKAKALRSAAFQALVEAAGSKGKVRRYCARLLQPTATPSPGQTAKSPSADTPSDKGNRGNGQKKEEKKKKDKKKKKKKQKPNPGRTKKPPAESGE